MVVSIDKTRTHTHHTRSEYYVVEKGIIRNCGNINVTKHLHGDRGEEFRSFSFSSFPSSMRKKKATGPVDVRKITTLASSVSVFLRPQTTCFRTQIRRGQKDINNINPDDGKCSKRMKQAYEGRGKVSCRVPVRPDKFK